MMAIRIVIILLIQCYSLKSTSQSNSLFTNAVAIDEYRYDDIRDSPYQFDSWLPGIVYTVKGDPIEVEQLNINGYSKEVEIRRGSHFIELDQAGYGRIEVISDDGIKHVFVRDLAGNFRDRFVELVHEGTKIQCVRQFVVPMIDIEIQNVGKTEKIKRFNPKFVYTFIRDGDIEEVKFKEKQLLAYLGNKKELSKIFDKAKFKNEPLHHLKEILVHFESL